MECWNLPSVEVRIYCFASSFDEGLKKTINACLERERDQIMGTLTKKMVDECAFRDDNAAFSLQRVFFNSPTVTNFFGRVS